MVPAELIHQKLKIRSEKIKALIDSSQMPRNQVASISGLSNTYIRDLELGNIVNVSRDKILSLSIAFNLTLKEIDDLLNIFEQANLSSHDIPIIIEISKKIKFSSAMIPLRDRFRLDLMMLSAERIPGNLKIFSSRPTHSLRAEGHASYSERHFLEKHPISGELIESINRERKQFLTLNLKRFGLDHYICKDCLEDYIIKCSDPVEKKWRCSHVKNLIWCLENYEKCHVYITRDCPTFLIVLKESLGDKQPIDRLLMTYIPPHSPVSRNSGRFVGFATGNTNVVNNFKNDLVTTQSAIIPELNDRKSIIPYLRQLISN